MKWTLTQAIPGEPEIDVREDDEEDLELGFRYLRGLAELDGRSVWTDAGSGPGFMRPVARSADEQG